MAMGPPAAPLRGAGAPAGGGPGRQGPAAWARSLARNPPAQKPRRQTGMFSSFAAVSPSTPAFSSSFRESQAITWSTGAICQGKG